MLILKIRMPNIPFFWLVFRAWSHWRGNRFHLSLSIDTDTTPALLGSKHVQHLIDHRLIIPAPTTLLDLIYSLSREELAIERTKAEIEAIMTKSKYFMKLSTDGREETVMTKSQGRILAQCLEMPELGPEVDRAVVQVKKTIDKDQEKESDRDG